MFSKTPSFAGAAFIFSEAGIEDIIIESGGYTYTNGQSSIFNKIQSGQPDYLKEKNVFFG